jgi:hypothetical protein
MSIKKREDIVKTLYQSFSEILGKKIDEENIIDEIQSLIKKSKNVVTGNDVLKTLREKGVKI